jgi:hypothetical protein
MQKARQEYRKFQVKALSPVEVAYLETIKSVSRIAKRKGKAPKDDDETDALNNAGVVAGEYQVAADGKTVYKVPKFTIASEIPSPSTPGVLGDIIVVVNTNS